MLAVFRKRDAQHGETRATTQVSYIFVAFPRRADPANYLSDYTNSQWLRPNTTCTHNTAGWKRVGWRPSCQKTRGNWVLPLLDSAS